MCKTDASPITDIDIQNMTRTAGPRWIIQVEPEPYVNVVRILVTLCYFGVTLSYRYSITPVMTDRATILLGEISSLGTRIWTFWLRVSKNDFY